MSELTPPPVQEEINISNGPHIVDVLEYPNGTVVEYWDYGPDKAPGRHVKQPQEDGTIKTFAYLGRDHYINDVGEQRGGWGYVDVTGIVDAIPDPVQQAQVISSIEFVLES